MEWDGNIRFFFMSKLMVGIEKKSSHLDQEERKAEGDKELVEYITNFDKVLPFH